MDAQDFACIDMPGMGGMGVHYVKSALVQSGTIDAARPQALVYGLDPNGRLQLVVLEYLVLQSTWDSAHTTPPMLFGQKFQLTGGQDFQLDATTCGATLNPGASCTQDVLFKPTKAGAQSGTSQGKRGDADDRDP